MSLTALGGLLIASPSPAIEVPPRPVVPLAAMPKEIATAEAVAANIERDQKQSRLYVPVELNARVKKWLKYFTREERGLYKRYLQRGNLYRRTIEEILARFELPRELYFLAMIESGFVLDASSEASAVGIWQFIRETGVRFGLTTHYYVDERKDPVRSTEAAARYLKDLYKEFNSWPLAIAAYNSGERRVRDAIRAKKTRNFFTLADIGALPAETIDYVPKFMAAVLIGRNPKYYGFNIEKVERLPRIRSVRVPAPVHLRSISSLAGVPYLELKRLNPHLHQQITPPGAEDYPLWVQDNQVVKIRRLYSQLAQFKMSGLQRREYASQFSIHYHTVQKGETIDSIAKKYRIPSDAIRRINQLTASEPRQGSKLRVAVRNYSGQAVGIW